MISCMTCTLRSHFVVGSLFNDAFLQGTRGSGWSGEREGLGW